MAAIAAAYLVRISGTLTPADRAAVAVLGALAMAAELLSFLMPHGVRGSIAFIPYLACVLVVPHWVALIPIVAITAIMQIVIFRTRVETRIFNVAQQALTLSVAIIVYLQLGGRSFLTIHPEELGALTTAFGLPALSAYAVSFFVNSLVVSTSIAIKEGASPYGVWRDLKLSSIGVDLLASPIVFVFAWVYARFDAIAAAAVWVPIVGLRQVHTINLELERTNQELLELMVKSIEARDPYTSGHSRRVQHYSLMIARAIGLREKEIGAVGQAALLHDVGKIHEKYGPLLSKADRLNAEEWAVMKEHPADGAKLVATMTRLRELVGAIRHHHENWDGSGYPEGLAEEQIPIAARIVRFADTIDAMTTDRPYRRPLSREQVEAEILRCRGTQFDPVITDRLLASPIWDALFSPMALPASGTWGLALVRTGTSGSRTA
ncbi:MAG: HD domain-containing protein [Gemmatimonadota bacterium]|nr:HD domain-containing protein [Gemmatimonadota bacterium]